jgi:iduronate 2-sulfatase
MHGYANGQPRRLGQSPPWQAYDGPDDAFPDAYVARDAVAVLEELAGSEPGQPWFLAVGFFKPHLPFAAPQRWFDLHDPDAIPEPAVTARPDGVSGWHGSGEFRNHYGHGGRDPDQDPGYARTLRHAYAAAVSYVDAQVGRVLDALDQLGLANDTVVIAWGDHGFLLGEHAVWGKHCLYEEAVRSPLIIRSPGLGRPGTPTEAVVETVDVFPTVADLCGLPPPPGLDGHSLRPQLDDPETPSAKPAHSFWTNSQRSIRTPRWRLVEHARDRAAPAYELFDLEGDPNESTNAAAAHPDVARDLAAQLDDVPAL